MKERKTIFIALVTQILASAILAFLIIPQVGALSPSIMSYGSSESLKVEASPPDRGTVMFTAQSKGNPVSEVEIKIDGERKGFTDENGKLKVNWLLFGNHAWEAAYEGAKISQGEFKIERIDDIEISDFHYEKDGNRVNKFYPLKDTLTRVVVYRNTGTTVIDHWTWTLKAIPSKGEMEIKILHPKVPSFVLNIFKDMITKMFFTEMGREISIKDGRMTDTNIFTQESQEFEVGEAFTGKGKEIELPSGVKGLKPGEVCIWGEERAFAEWVRENVENKISEMGGSCKPVEKDDEKDTLHTLATKVKYGSGPTKLEAKNIEFRTIDKESGFMSVQIKEAKCGPVKVKDIEAMVQLKGLLKEEVKVYIDDKLCDSKEYGFEWLYEESLGGETIGKFAGT